MSERKLVVLVGPPGSGKTTIAKNYEGAGYLRISQDVMGADYIQHFDDALLAHKNIVVDRMNFSVQQRQNFIMKAKALKYYTTIIVIHESYQTCFDRCMKRENHETIKNEKNARSALHTFFTKYERVQDIEADEVNRVWPGGDKPKAIICDLDGTLCNVDHRLHHVRVEGKKNWKGFFEDLSGDKVNEWCSEILKRMSSDYKIIYCSGRSRDYRDLTIDWLKKNNLNNFDVELNGNWDKYQSELFMRPYNDFRQDNIIKEILLDFEILTRYKPFFAIDDRQQVVDMWRKRGITCLQCAKGDF